MILGIPNVGKSSFINRIAKRNTAVVGNKPGVTKQKQWIRLSNNIDLMDTPGVLWPKFESEKVALNLAFTGTIKDDILPKIEVAYRLTKFLIENYIDNVLERYKLSKEEVEEILNRDEPIKKKRIAIRKLGNKGLEKKFVKLFLNLLEYVSDELKALKSAHGLFITELRKNFDIIFSWKSLNSKMEKKI